MIIEALETSASGFEIKLTVEDCEQHYRRCGEGLAQGADVEVVNNAGKGKEPLAKKEYNNTCGRMGSK